MTALSVTGTPDVPATADLVRLYRDWQAADRLFTSELERAFGRDACNRRYDMDKSLHPAGVREAQLAFVRAGTAWRTAYFAKVYSEVSRETVV